MATIDEVCRAAWEATRSEVAVPYDELIPEYRGKLVSNAQEVLNGRYPQEPWQVFETQVLQLADGRGSMQIGDDKSESNGPKGKLPEDFPARDKLHEAGINTYTQLSKVKDLTEIKGIGAVLAAKITERLEHERGNG